MDNNRAAHVHATAASDMDDYDDVLDDCDMVLSKEDFAMLHALHRFVPLPALSSNILRIVCDDDIQVATETAASGSNGSDDDDENDSDNDTERALASLSLTVAATAARVRARATPTDSSPLLLKHSPLTRRLVKPKPRVAIDLVSASPQFQRRVQEHQNTGIHTGNNNPTSSKFTTTSSRLDDDPVTSEQRVE